jgi:hypothetical protein
VVRDVPLDLGRHEPPDGSPLTNFFPDGTRRNIQDRKNRAKQTTPAGETVRTPRETIATVSLHFNTEPGGKRRLGGSPRTGEHQKIARSQEVEVSMPGDDLRERVGADQEQEVGPRVSLRHLADREQGVRRALAPQFEVEDRQSLDSRDGRGRHREPVFRGSRRPERLVGRPGGRNEEEVGQREPLPDLDRHPKVAVVERIEGAAEEGEAAAHHGHYCRT